MGVFAVARAVCAGFEKFVQYVVFIGGNNQAVDRQTHLAGNMAGADIAEVAAWYAEADFFIIARSGIEITGKVIYDLSDDTAPVDGVDCTDVVFGFEFGIVLYGFDDVLAVVKHAFNGDVVDISILQAEHLRTLECAHFAFRRQHEDINAFFTAQGIFGGRAGVAAGGAQDIEFFAFFV